MSKRILLFSMSRNGRSLENEMYPSGALMLLGPLLKKQGHIVKVVHNVADRVNAVVLPRLLHKFNPDIVGFTVCTYQSVMTKVLMGKVKTFNDKIVTVIGGPHPSALGDECLTDCLGTDIAVYGEGERAIIDIAQDVPLSQIQGIHYWSNGKIVTNPPAPLLTSAELDALPLPDKSLVNFKRFVGIYPVGRRPCMCILASRGCPYSCSFCSHAVYGEILRQRSPERVIEEVGLLYRDWGVREIHFIDDTFNANLIWSHKLLDLIIQNGYHKKLIFRVAMRVNEKIVNLELLRHLKAAGVWLICYGVENGNQGMLDRMCKGITIEEIKRAFRLTHSVGLKPLAFIILGTTGETAQSIQDTRNLCKEIKPYWSGVSKAIPYLGTTFYQEVRNAGHQRDDSYGNFASTKMQVRTETLSVEELDRLTAAMIRMTRWNKIAKPKQDIYAIVDAVGTNLNRIVSRLGNWNLEPLLNIGIGRIPGVHALYKFIWRNFGPRGVKLIRVNGLAMYIPCRDWAVAPTLLFAHVWEPAETKICEQYIKEGMTVIDAGAYIGYFSLLASRLVGSKGKVYAFEPSPGCLELLHKNIRLNNCKNIRVFEKAVIDKEGHTIFFANPNSLSGSSMFANYSALVSHKSPQIKVPTTTLDEVAGDNRVDFIKMDIEGGETKALRGMTKIIKNNPSLKMIIEVFPEGLIKVGSNLEEYVGFLQRHFKLHIIGKYRATSDAGLQDIQMATRKAKVLNLFCQRRGDCV